MKPLISRIIAGVVVAGFATGMWFLEREARRVRNTIDCNTLDINICGTDSLVTEDEIHAFVDKYYGTYIGVRINDIDLVKLESMLRGRDAVKGCEAWVTDDGSLHMEITQRKPILRFESGNKGYYVDESGFIFPLNSGSWTADVPVVECELWRGFNGDWLDGILASVRTLSSDKVVGKRIDSYEVDDEGNLVLLSEGTRFFLGDPADIERKTAAVRTYCERIEPKGKNYTKVYVSYKGQIICRND